VFFHQKSHLFGFQEISCRLMQEINGDRLRIFYAAESDWSGWFEKVLTTGVESSNMFSQTRELIISEGFGWRPGRLQMFGRHFRLLHIRVLRTWKNLLSFNRFEED
jgi:hypothetical protein